VNNPMEIFRQGSRTSKLMSRDKGMALLLATAFSGSPFLPFLPDRHGDPPPRKCLLPGCENTTDHNGGYCCAEHCKAHRIEQRKTTRGVAA